MHGEHVGIPTFFSRPVAMMPENLKAGKIDVAIFGAPLGAVMPAGGGQWWGPSVVRAPPTGNQQYGSEKAPLGLSEYETLIEPFNVLNVVDYGDVNTHNFNMMVSQEELRKVTQEVAETGAIPFIIGGDHSVPFGGYRDVAHQTARAFTSAWSCRLGTQSLRHSRDNLFFPRS